MIKFVNIQTELKVFVISILLTSTDTLMYNTLFIEGLRKKLEDVIDSKFYMHSYASTLRARVCLRLIRVIRVIKVISDAVFVASLTHY